MRGLQLAYAYSSQEKYDAALADLEKCLQFDPRNVLAYANRGVIREKQGHLQESLADYNRAVDLDSKSVYALPTAGSCKSI